MRTRILFLITLGAFLTIQNATAQWIQIIGMNGEPVYKTRATSTKLFAMTANGVLQSPLNGPNWNIVPQLYLTNVVESLSTAGDTIVAFAQPSSYLSTNNGTSWSTISNGPSSVVPIEMVAGANKLFLATLGDYLYVSVNNGSTWNQVTSGITTSNINTISVDGNRVVLGTDNGVYISNNGGNSFAFAGLAGEFISKIHVKDNYIFTYGFNGVMQSADAGLTWTSFNPLIPYSDIVDFAVSGNKVFATTSGILMMSDVFAANWTQVSFNTQVAFNVNIQFNNSVCNTINGIYVGSNRGVFKTINNGGTWDEFNNNLQTQNVFGLAVANNNVLFTGSSLYGVSNYNSGLWNYSGLALYNCNHVKARGNDIYVATDFGINRTTDNGLTWPLFNGQGANPITGFCQRVDFKDTLIVGACLQQGVLRSGDDGATWAFQNSGMPNAFVSSISICGNNIIAGSFNEGLYTSTDGGFTWSQTGAAGELINDITSIGNRVLASSQTANYLSNDAGLTWNIVSNNYYEDLYSHNGLVFASASGYVHISRDSGQTFNDIITGPANANIISLTATNDDLYVGTVSNGVWKRSISEVLGTADPIAQISTARMIPNLFRDKSMLVVSEDLAGKQAVLEIIDQSGKTVYKSIIQEVQTPIDAKLLSPGLYYYTVSGGIKNQASGKFIVY
ncbi:MAG: hypothetical protein RL090_1836 [Bacteroidota bacterium]